MKGHGCWRGLCFQLARLPAYCKSGETTAESLSMTMRGDSRGALQLLVKTVNETS